MTVEGFTGAPPTGQAGDDARDGNLAAGIIGAGVLMIVGAVVLFFAIKRTVLQSKARKEETYKVK